MDNCYLIILLFAGMALGVIFDELISSIDFEKHKRNKKADIKDKNEW